MSYLYLERIKLFGLDLFTKSRDRKYLTADSFKLLERCRSRLLSQMSDLSISFDNDESDNVEDVMELLQVPKKTKARRSLESQFETCVQGDQDDDQIEIRLQNSETEESSCELNLDPNKLNVDACAEGSTHTQTILNTHLKPSDCFQNSLFATKSFQQQPVG